MEKNEMKKDMLLQLEKNGTREKCFIDLVDDYLAMWETKKKLVADIRKNGVKVIYISSNGTENQKKNESVDMLVKVNAQMLKLLSELGIKASREEMGMDDEL